EFLCTLIALRRGVGHHVVAEQAALGQGENLSGYVDVVSMKAFKYGEGKSAPATLTEHMADKNHEELLEALADFDDHLMEEILEGQEPPLDEVERDLVQDVSEDKIVPVV